MNIFFRRGAGGSTSIGLPTRLSRGSIPSGNGSGDDSTTQDDTIDGEDATN